MHHESSRIFCSDVTKCRSCYHFHRHLVDPARSSCRPPTRQRPFQFRQLTGADLTHLTPPTPGRVQEVTASGPADYPTPPRGGAVWGRRVRDGHWVRHRPVSYGRDATHGCSCRPARGGISLACSSSFPGCGRCVVMCVCWGGGVEVTGSTIATLMLF